MWLAIALMLIGFVLLILGLVVMPGLGSPSSSHRTGKLAAAIVGGFLIFVGLILALAGLR